MKLKENESLLKETKTQIKEKQTLVIQHDTEFQTVQFKSDTTSVTRKYSLKKAMDLLKKEINELRCVEQKLTRQNELISGPLGDLGCELPTGHDLDAQSQTSLGKKKSTQVMHMLRKPFSKKSG